MKDITSFINNSKTYISNLNQKGVDVSLSHKSYIHSESNSSTFHILLHNNLFAIIKTKIFYSIRNLINFYKYDERFLSHGNLDLIKNKNLIFSWILDTNYKYDNYYNVERANVKDATWILLSEEINNQNYIPDNIILFNKSKNGILKKTLNFFINIKKIILVSRSISLFFYYFSSESLLAIDLFEFTNKMNIYNNTKNLLIVYEGQPFNNYLINKIKIHYKNIKVYGLVHSTLPMLPLNYIKRRGHPDYLLTPGKDQVNSLLNYLGWKNKEIVEINSVRYTKTNIKFNNKIILPIFKIKVKIILQEIKNYLLFNKLNIANFDILIHPANKNKKQFKELKECIKKNIQFSNKYDESSKNICVCIGATSTILEALSLGIDVIHFFDNHITQPLNNQFWPSIKINYVSKNCVLYSIKKNNFLNLGKENEFINLYKNIN